jgi:hypothetical protein
MNALLQLVFVLFYITSVYAAAELKTTHYLQKIQHASRADDGPAIESAFSQEDRALPHYREAKKSSKDFEYLPLFKLEFRPPTTIEKLSAQHRREVFQYRTQPLHPRAPPQ